MNPSLPPPPPFSSSFLVQYLDSRLLASWKFASCLINQSINQYINIQEIENMYRVSIELNKHEGKFGRTRNAVGTRAAGECFHSFF